MHGQFHREITTKALRNCFSQQALEKIIRANLGQDGLRGQIWHPEYHFDDCKFMEGRDYIRDQREIIFDHLKGLKARQAPGSKQQEINQAWTALGRLMHAAQDFYAHSNYVALWLAREHLWGADRNEKIPVEKIDPLDPDLLYSSGLRSGRTYFPWDYLAFVQPLKQFIRRVAPQDSHANMNLDAPERGPKFAYAYMAALKRTRYESGTILRVLSQDLLWQFTGGILKRNREAVEC